jgi:hypothetical protein
MNMTTSKTLTMELRRFGAVAEQQDCTLEEAKELASKKMASGHKWVLSESSYYTLDGVIDYKQYDADCELLRTNQPTPGDRNPGFTN